jgi:threonine/homoserine/homoserine lactone efflux protein
MPGSSFTALASGLAAGFFGAVPVAGPISALVLRLGIERRYQEGRILAAGAGIAESVYVLLAFMGFQELIESRPSLRIIATLLAAIVLILLGLSFILKRKELSRPPTDPANSSASGNNAFWIGLSISLANPTLLLTWTTFLSILSAYSLFPFDRLHSFFFSAGVGVGITLWFSTLISILKRSEGRLPERTLNGVLITIGALLILLGLKEVGAGLHLFFG